MTSGNVVEVMPQFLETVSYTPLIEIDMESLVEKTEAGKPIVVTTLVPMERTSREIHSLLLTHVIMMIGDGEEVKKLPQGLSADDQKYLDFLKEVHKTLYTAEVIPFKSPTQEQTLEGLVLEMPWKDGRGRFILRHRRLLDLGNTR